MPAASSGGFATTRPTGWAVHRGRSAGWLRRYHRPVRRWAGALPLAAALLAGCTDGADDPTVLSSASPTPSPSPSISPPPSEATPQGAAAFARYWYDVLNQAGASGNTTLLRQLSAPQCQTCANFIGSIETVYPKGRFRGGRHLVRFAEAPAFSGRTAQVSILVDIGRTDVLDSSGKVLQSEPAAEGVELEMTLSRRDSGWIVIDLVELSGKQ